MESVRIYAWGRVELLSPLPEHSISFSDRRKLEFWILRADWLNLEYDKTFSWFMIPDLPMPPVIQQPISRLLVTLPVQNQQHPQAVYPNAPPDSFYLDSNLIDLDGRPVSNLIRGTAINFSKYNDKLSHGFCRFPLPLNSWQPSWDIKSGDCLTTIVQTILFEISGFGISY